MSGENGTMSHISVFFKGIPNTFFGPNSIFEILGSKLLNSYNLSYMGPTEKLGIFLD